MYMYSYILRPSPLSDLFTALRCEVPIVFVAMMVGWPYTDPTPGLLPSLSPRYRDR